jgi:hypothetical protein
MRIFFPRPAALHLTRARASVCGKGLRELMDWVSFWWASGGRFQPQGNPPERANLTKRFKPSELRPKSSANLGSHALNGDDLRRVVRVDAQAQAV